MSRVVILELLMYSSENQGSGIGDLRQVSSFMVTIKSPEEIIKLKHGGKILAEVLVELEKYCKESFSSGELKTIEIDKKCGELLSERGVKSSFKNYSPGGSLFFPANICVSVNNEVVHGLPGERILKEGDLVSLDLGVIYEDLYTDAAISFVLGESRSVDKKLVNAAKIALYAGIDKAIIGNKIGDISNAIEESILESGFGIVRNYCGHGVGYGVHEEPSIPNYGKAGIGMVLEEGMILAIEPMLTEEGEDTIVESNDWTVKTKDGKKASHWEHTIAITKDGPSVLTSTE